MCTLLGEGDVSDDVDRRCADVEYRSWTGDIDRASDMLVEVSMRSRLLTALPLAGREFEPSGPSGGMTGVCACVCGAE